MRRDPAGAAPLSGVLSSRTPAAEPVAGARYPDAEYGERGDDYQVDREAPGTGPTAAAQLLRLLLGLVLLVVAAASLALCWVVVLMLHLV